MLFTSFTFWALAAGTILLAMFLRQGVYLRRMLLLASLIFYSGGDGANIAILIASACADYAAGFFVGPDRKQSLRKIALVSALGINLGILGYFKYLRFLLTEIIPLIPLPIPTIDPSWHQDLILPLGVSFYTFQSMSYTIDVYRGKAQTCRNFFDFFLYVSFFPQLLAGPIERANHLLPQIKTMRICTWAEARVPAILIAVAFFKKLFVADSIGPTAQMIFVDSTARPLEIFVAGWTMALQVYFDFSAYSDFALGLALIFGVKLTPNFRPVWFASNPLAFWERWNITTGKWFRDYLLIPIGGNGKNRIEAARNMIVMFIAIGFWHGASWNWLVWGLMQGVVVAVYRDLKKNSSWVAATPAWIGFFFIQFMLLPLSGLLHHANTTEKVQRILTVFSGTHLSWLDISGLKAILPHLGFYLVPAIILDIVDEKFDLKKTEPQLLFVLIAICLGFAFFLAKGISNQSFIYFAF